MNPKTFRDHISQQCGFNKAKTIEQIDNEIARRKQRLTDHYKAKPIDLISQKRAKPYALQVCNAGKMPDHLPTSFEDWLASNSDSIEMPLDRTEATAQWFDDKEQGEKQSIPF